MNRPVRCARSATVVAALTVSAMAVALPMAAASGSAVPFHDTNVRGSLTFCNRAGQPITSGSLDTAPFAWKTVSSAVAPVGYRGTDARATLYAYQPIQFVDPGDWSGSQLTGSSSYTNPDHPVDQATNVDSALLGFTQAYPSHWDNLIELRMFYSAFNKPAETSTYPAAVVRVTGSTWTLVSGGGSSCASGQGVSDETALLPKKVLRKKHVVVPAGSATPAASTSSPTSGSSSAPTGSASISTGAARAATGAATDDPASSGLGTGAKTAIGLAVLALVGVAAATVYWWRRRTSPVQR